MLGELNEAQIEELLNNQMMGRIGCHADGITYIIPINYAYDGKYIYAHSAPGKKIEIMRKNPNVCFQVDKVDNIVNWQSVLTWGTYEEIDDLHTKQHIMQKLIMHFSPFLNQFKSAHPSHGFAERDSDIGITKEIVVYRIAIDKKIGRFEKVN